MEKILSSQQIKIGLMKYLNDPRESKDWALLPKFTGIPTNSLPLEERLVNQEFIHIKQEEWKVVCFSTHAPKYKRHPNSSIDEGFLHGACRPRMWASYGENHKGVCLKFNGKKFDRQIRIKPERTEKDRRVFHGKVKYIDYGDTLDSISIDYTELSKIDMTQGLRNHLIKHHKEFFLLKPTDWKTEFEYRWLVHSKDRAAEFLPIKGIVEEVIVGFEFPRVYFPSLFELCDQLDIPVRGMIWKNGMPFVSTYIHESRKVV